MTHIPAYYRARRDAERAWRAWHPQLTIEGFDRVLDEADVASGVGLVEREVGRDVPPSGSDGRTCAAASPPGDVPSSHGLTSGAEPGYRQVGTDGNPLLGAGGSAVAADAWSSASAPFHNATGDGAPLIPETRTGPQEGA